MIHFLTVNALKKAGGFGDIEVVINGLEAINLLKETPQFADLILLDINMPVMDGLDLPSKPSNLKVLKVNSHIHKFNSRS